MKPRQVVIYQTLDGRMPYTEWYASIRDWRIAARIDARILRLAEGNPGDVKPVGDGVFELRLMFGPGYRIYFAESGGTLVLLLLGGDKSTQSRDIAKAKEYWMDYKDRPE